MGRLIRICVHTLIMGAIFLLLLCCIFFATMQTQWGKQKITELFILQFRQMGISAHIKGLEGQLPFSWKVDEIDINIDSNQSIQFQQVTLRIAFFPLLRKHLVIDYFNAESAEYTYRQTESELEDVHWDAVQHRLQQKIQQLSPLFHLSIHHLNVERVHCNNLSTGKSLTFALLAKGKWRKDNKEFLCFCKASSPDNSQVYIEFFINGNLRRDEISTGIKAHLDSIETLPTSRALPFEGEALFEIQLKGPWKTWKALVWNGPPIGVPLSGKMKAKLRNVSVSKLPLSLRKPDHDAIEANPDIRFLLNRDWRFASVFSLAPNRTVFIEKLLLFSDLVQLYAKGELASDLLNSKGIITCSVPNLAPLSQLAHSQLEGSSKGKGYYDQGRLKATLSTNHLKVNGYPVETLRSMLFARPTANRWSGFVKLTANEGVLPFDARCIFAWKPEAYIQLKDIAINAHETAVTGHLSATLPHLLFEGGLYGNVRHLSQFAPLFPNSGLDGGFGAECIFSLEKGRYPAQNVRFYFLSKNLRYFDQLIDDLSISAQIVDLYRNPQGKVEILAEKIYTPQAYFNQVFLRTHSESDTWPFYLNITASSLEPFDLNAEGFWKKDEDTLSLEVDRADGVIAAQNFKLEAPFSIEWGKSHFGITPSEWSVGLGSLFASVSFTPVQSLIDMEMEHFPLQVLSIFKPKFSLQGTITAAGFLDATPKNIEGALNIVLEEAGIYHYGKKKPWRAKGSVQAHLNHSMLQIHSDLHAIGNQFLECSASVPMDYSLYPFRLHIDDMRHLSGELVGEGRIQDIFDFVNIGTHHITGFLSCRLFLSKTFAAPALQGEMQLQNGTYENYTTGTLLKHINAEAEALNDKIHLISLTATDEDKGELTADGILQLKPHAYYPYAFSCELDNLHLLRFDTVDCHFTGPLYITGNSQAALAQGNLYVPYATFHIPDRLPYDVPQLPVTYVNRPSYLSSPQITPHRVFPFHMDLELTADGDVHVEGKGLTSEWEGSVHLTGTNMTVAASGSLSLINGDYLFSGKDFKLTEGEIVFNDKPTPSAYLNLSGNLSLSDMEVMAHLRGPLTSPQLTFQSNPHMPTSSILARILFNKDISDISHPEALQLANTLMSLSGGAGPDVLETIRKSIGVDRLTIVSSRAGSDQIAVQIGKYLTKGVMITLSQSATSSQVIVEVELSKGFIFQAETQEEEEGKFSLKWRKSY